MTGEQNGEALAVATRKLEEKRKQCDVEARKEQMPRMGEDLPRYLSELQKRLEDRKAKCSACGRLYLLSAVGLCEECEQKAERTRRIMQAMSAIPEKFRNGGDFVALASDPVAQGVIKSCGNAIDLGWSVYLFGPTGSGKTTLAAAMFRSLVVLQGRRATWSTLSSYLSEFEKAAKGKTMETVEDIVSRYALLARQGWLFLDDVGREAVREGRIEKIGLLVDEIYGAGKSARIFMTGNFSLDDLFRHWQGRQPSEADIVAARRIVSRLAEMCHAIEYNVGDRRLV